MILLRILPGPLAHRRELFIMHAHDVRGTVVLAALFMLLPGILSAQVAGDAIDRLTHRADVVAIGRVKETKAEWNETRSSIRTRVTLNVEEYLKGSAGNSFDVFVPGGEVEGVGELYTHMPAFSKDEEVVVFLEKDKRNRWRISGGNQGKFSVATDKKSGKRVVANYWPTDEFKSQVKKSMSARKRE
jgi:hypothetical protein